MAKEQKELTVDTEAPPTLRLKFEDSNAVPWTELIAGNKVFSSGSKGFYATGKIINPKSGKTYQVSCSITLVGSKPPKE